MNRPDFHSICGAMYCIILTHGVIDAARSGFQPHRSECFGRLEKVGIIVLDNSHDASIFDGILPLPYESNEVI